MKRITGVYPKNEDLYRLAFIHKSASLKLPDGLVINNERLEFLGDAILDAVVAEFLYRKFPDRKEGFLTQTRAKIVNGASLARLAKDLGLEQFVISHTNNQNSNKHIMGDAFEALIGALYLDHNYKAVKSFVFKQLLKKHIDIEEVINTDTNFKSRLIEKSQKDKQDVAFDTTLIESSSAIAPEFISKVLVNGIEVGIGYGMSKKEAEQNAAEQALINLE